MENELIFVWIYFFCGASGALWMIKIFESSLTKVFHIIEKTIRVEKYILKDLEKENEDLETKTIKLNEEHNKLLMKKEKLEEIYFARIIGEEGM